MTRYETYLTLHVLTAIIWLGAGFTFFLLGLKAVRSPNPAEGSTVTDQNEWLVPRLFIPASLAVFVFGLLMVVDGPWSFGDLWITIGLVGFLASFLTGILFLAPEARRLHQALKEHGPTSPLARRHTRRLLVASRVELALLFIVAADMVVKPTGDDGWLLAAGAALFVAIAALAVLTAPFRMPESGTAAEAA